MRIFLVCRLDQGALAVYSTRELAELWIKAYYVKLEEEIGEVRDKDDFWIEEWELDGDEVDDG
jgi:hypothetical protein